MFTMTTNGLRAALRVSAKKDIRYYLNGVCLQFGEQLYTVATDGHVLFAGRQALELPEGETRPPAEIIIPNEAVVAALRGYKGKTIVLEPLSGGRYLLGNTLFRPIDGKFPSWTKLVPEKPTNEIAQFNPEYPALCARALRDWHATKADMPLALHLHHNGMGCAIMQGLDDTAFCAIMPWRAEQKPGLLAFKPVYLSQPTAPVAIAA